jgi:ribosome-associated protein
VPAQQDAVEAAVAAIAAAEDKKAVDPVLLEVADVLGVVDLFAVVHGTSERHVKAVADAVELELKRDHDRPVLRREGTSASGWVLLDYGDVVVHVFHAEQREVFQLERLWGDVPKRDPETGDVTDPGRLQQREQRDDLLVEG